MSYPSWLAPIFAIVFFLVGLNYTIVGIMDLVRKITRRDWILAQAKITYCETISIGELLRAPLFRERLMNFLGLLTNLVELSQPGTNSTICMRVKYEYNILGQRYESEERLRFSVPHQQGDNVKCYVNPARITESSIEVLTWKPLLFLMAGLGLLACGMAIFFLFF